MILSTIKIAPQLHHAHQRVLLRYLIDDLSLAHSDWVMLTEAADALGVSVVMVDGQERTFRQFYDEQIDRQFADPFLSNLVALTDVEIEGRRAQASIAQDIGRLLDGVTGFSRDNRNCRLLFVYCLYWWAAFARGYIFEVAIYRDLTASGVQFVAHDITNRDERMAPYDLLLLDLRGDIKYTTYFLTSERLTRLCSDFFITRWYLRDSRGWLRVAILRETAWSALEFSHDAGAPQITTLNEVGSFLPQAATFVIDTLALTALGYDRWKRHVLMKQSMREE